MLSDQIKKLKGLTIIELLVVFFVIGILVAVATPSANRMYQDSRLNRHGEEVVAYFRQARQFAVTEQQLYGVQIFQTANDLALLRLTLDPIDPNLYIEEEISTFHIEEPLTIQSTDLTEGEIVKFNSIGNPNKAAGIVLADDYGRQRSVCINIAGSIQLKIGGGC